MKPLTLMRRKGVISLVAVIIIGVIIGLGMMNLHNRHQASLERKHRPPIKNDATSLVITRGSMQPPTSKEASISTAEIETTVNSHSYEEPIEQFTNEPVTASKRQIVSEQERAVPLGDDDGAGRLAIDVLDDSVERLPSHIHFLKQSSYGRGIGNSVAEYNFGLLFAKLYNMTLLHTDLRCARISEQACADIFQLRSHSPYSDALVNKSLVIGQVTQVDVDVKKLHGHKKVRTFIQKHLDIAKQQPNKQYLFKIVGSTASHNFSLTQDFWSNAYREARKVVEYPCQPKTVANQSLNVVIHIRRGDVQKYADRNQTRLMKLRYLPDSYFIEIASSLADAGLLNRAVITIATDGSRDDVSYLMDSIDAVLRNSKRVTYIEGSVQFHYHPTGAVNALHILASADLAIGSKSGFTQLASIVGFAGGWGVKLLPYADWPTYDGIKNVIKIPERIPGVEQERMNWRKVVVEKVKYGLRKMAENIKESNETWVCPERGVDEIKRAIKNALAGT